MGSWWIPSSVAALEVAESRLLNSKNFPVRVTNTPISNGMHIHAIQAGEGKSKTPLVLCHGYGLGAACWISTVARLSRHFHVYANDWIGCGNSARPQWDKKGTEENEDFFVDTLEEWREANGIDKMVLCGHSLGGYLSVCYAEKHPERVEKLVLASPAGVPDHPPEFLTRGIDQLPAGRRAIFRSAIWLWTQGVTPGDIVRVSGPYGRRLVDGYAKRRLGGTLDRDLLADYLYHNIAATRGSGDKALPELLLPGAFAVKPLIGRIGKLDPNIKVFFLYGDHDWMDFRNAIKVQQRLKAEGSKQRVDLLVVSNAGHQLFLDNEEGFDEALLAIMRAPARGWSGRSPTALVTDAMQPPPSPPPAPVEPDMEAVAAPSVT